MIIGIAGTLGAGKGTVVEYLKAKGFSHYSSSDVLRRILKERGLSAERQNLSSLANELMHDYDGGVLHFSHQYAKEEQVNNYILEALHRVSEAEYIKKIDGLILGVDADIAIRYSRISDRKEGVKDDVTFDQFVLDSKREDDGAAGSGPNIRAVMKLADYTIMNNGSVAELHAQVDRWLQTITAD